MDSKNLTIVFFGTPEFVTPVLLILQENFNLIGIVTSPDKKVGRKQLLTASPVKQFYQSKLFGAKKGPSRALILAPEKFTPDVAQRLNNLHPDLFVVAAYGKIIPANILDIPKFGALNIHPSLLPKYRGPSPIQSAILNGDKTSGISIIEMDEKMDHGPVIYAEEFKLSDKDTFQTLSTNMFLRSAEILAKIIPAYLAGKLKLLRQDDAIAEYCRIVKKEDGYFDINNPPSFEQLDRMIRAYHPWPTAWTKWNGKIVKFLPSPVIPAKVLRSRGHQDRGAGIHGSRIKYGMTEIEIQNDKFLIQIEGKKPVKFEDFLRGYPNFPIFL